MEYLAHISEDGERYQTVKEHLVDTASLAKKFASAFGAEDAAELAGMLHDIGKYSDAFQRRLAGGVAVDHSTAGAKEALKRGNPPVAFAIAGHHGGIPDGGSIFDDPNEGTLMARNKKQVEDYLWWEQEIPENMLSESQHYPSWSMSDNVTSSFFTRMIYSCLVDADFIDTEKFMQGGSIPRGMGEPLRELLDKVQRRADTFLGTTSSSLVNKQRNAVLRDCIERGKNGKQGLYTLTVPTGGGKTFASLAFAMNHAVAQGMKRVIYVIPYTSIIDQTTQVFYDLLGEENVLAHFSTVDYKLEEQENLTPLQYRKLLTCENWDAPVIVTTAVQFFESFYSNRSSQCRKLHNIADSVVIFDEAQTLPNDYLKPCLSVIAQLVEHYHTSAVLCTATQPTLAPFFKELAPALEIKEIVHDPETLYQNLRRVTIADPEKISAEKLCAELTNADQVLCVVNRRKTAQEIYKKLPEDGSYCLTTLLCVSDRRRQLEEIRARLKAGLVCRVVSTSLIEAGVDVDFPLAYREMAGLDQLIQTAGRCNREGKRSADESLVHSFWLEDSSIPGMLRQNVDASEYVVRCGVPLGSPESVRLYFQELYTIKGDDTLDKKSILDGLMNGIEGCSFPFGRIAEKFRLIDSPTKNIYIPIEEGEKLCQELREGWYSRALIRKLGLYSVSCYEYQFKELDDAGALEIADEGDAILIDMRQYSEKTGLCLNIETNSGLFFE